MLKTILTQTKFFWQFEVSINPLVIVISNWHTANALKKAGKNIERKLKMKHKWNRKNEEQKKKIVIDINWDVRTLERNKRLHKKRADNNERKRFRNEVF